MSPCAQDCGPRIWRCGSSTRESSPRASWSRTILGGRSSARLPRPSRTRRSTSCPPTRQCWPSETSCARPATCAASGRTDTCMAVLRLVHLYPDLMSVYGDRGNVLTLVLRAEWRGDDVEVQDLSLGDPLDPRQVGRVGFGAA